MGASQMAAGACARLAHVWSLAAAAALSVVLWTSATMAQAPANIVSLDGDLTPFLDRFKLPAVAAAVAKNGKIVAAGAVGTRRIGTDTPVTINDRFLRALIQGKAGAPIDHRTPPRVFPTLVTLATPATVGAPSNRPAVTVATVATLPEPEYWLALLRLPELPLLPAERWTTAADAVESLMATGALDKALGLGWAQIELVGVQRRQPHDAPIARGLFGA